MALIRWEPAAELNSIQNEMNRLFNTFFDQGAQGSTPATRWIPPMDLVENGDSYLLKADLPGMSEQDVKVQLQDNVLTVSGERKSDHKQQREGYYRYERAFGSFSRSLTLPEGVNPEGIKAHFDRGVLEISIPKPEQKKPRQVQIQVGGNTTDSSLNAGDSGLGNGDPNLIEGTMTESSQNNNSRESEPALA
jgi:HSP20 family protein